MKHFILAALAAFFFSCSKEAPPPPPSIEGQWVDMVGTFAPDWHYHFDNGLLTQDYRQFGVVITSLTYPYALRDSIVYIGGDATNAPREWLLRFECEDVVKINQQNTPIGGVFWLKRE